MTSLNETTLIGRIGKEPLPHIFQDGSKIIGFSLATSDKWKDKVTQEWKEKTEWHNISITNPTLIEYVVNQLNKGDLIHIRGKLRYRKWTKKDGTEGTTTEIVLEPYEGKISLIKKNDEAAKTYIEPVAYDQRVSLSYTSTAKVEGQLDDDDVPF